MDKAKEAIKKATSRSGQHDTTIHEQVAPAVQHERVSQTQHEETTGVLDREVHQDHYHTSEQPIHHSEVLPEQHHHKAVPIEHRTFEHDNKDDVQRRLQEERGAYADRHERIEGERTHEQAAAVVGEHKHHHVHETIQPIVKKETVEPHVVHTTVPVHEVHHNAAQHHSSSALPPVSMDEFKHSGGGLTGRGERQDHFAGEPRSFGGEQRHGDTMGTHQGTAGLNQGTSGYSQGTSGIGGHSGSGLDGRERYEGSGMDSSRNDGNFGTMTDSSNTSAGKPSMMDKLNPKKDATGDGEAGFMK